jgi:hypothetical protein
MAAREPLEERINATRERLARRSGTTAAKGTLGIDRAAWNELSVEDRCGLLGEVIETIQVGPASRRGAPFEIARISIRWRY